MSPTPTFALEILELIVDAVDPENPNNSKFTSDLSSCLFVSKDFRHCVLRRFYRNVGLDRRPDRVSRLLDLILRPASSQLGGVGRYIRDMFLVAEAVKDDAGQINVKKTVEPLGNEELISLIHILQNREAGGLRALSLLVAIAADVNTCPEWRDIPRKFQDIFHSTILSPSLKTLLIYGVKSFPLPLLKGTHLDTFRIAHCPWQNKNAALLSDTDLQSGAYPILKALHTDNSYPLDPMRHSLRCLDYMYSANIKPEHPLIMWQTITGSSATLKSLQISQKCRLDLQVGPPSLHSVVNLQDLIYHFYHSPGDVLYLSSLLELFDVKSPMMKFEKLTIFFDFTGLSPQDLPLLWADSRWAALSKLLASEKYPCLRDVRFAFAIRSHSTSDTELQIETDAADGQLKGALDQHFTCLSSLENISFEMSWDFFPWLCREESSGRQTVGMDLGFFLLVERRTWKILS